MIILIPLILLVVSLIATEYFYNKNSHSSIGGALLASSVFLGGFVLFSVVICLLEYSIYIKNLATVEYCPESVNETTIELNETIAINENDKIYNNKFSKTATFVSNHDTPIASTQEYLHDIQKDRSIERKKCLQAKRDVLSFKLGFFGFAS